MNVYFISGLGADQRMFQNIVLSEPFSMVHLDWMMPEPRETLIHYCHRMAARIDTSQPFALVGLSFGGMVSVEIARIIAPQTIILISSAAARSGLPPYYRLAGRLGLHRAVSISLMRRMEPFAQWFFGTNGPEEKRLLRQYLRHAPARLLKWSIASILTWNNKNKPPNVFHLHGTADRVLPIRYVKPDLVIKKGGHFMVWNHAAEISSQMNRHLEQYLPRNH